MRRRSRYVQYEDGSKINTSLKCSPRDTIIDKEDFREFRDSHLRRGEEQNFKIAPLTTSKKEERSEFKRHLQDLS